MNFGALFDKLAGDLSGAGVIEARGASGERVLELDGNPFARLHEEHLAVFLPTGSAALGDALALDSTTPLGDGWLEVAPDDVSEWPRLAQQALTAVRRD